MEGELSFCVNAFDSLGSAPPNGCCGDCGSWIWKNEQVLKRHEPIGMESGAYSRASARPAASNCTSLSHIDLISSCLALSAQGYALPSNTNASTFSEPSPKKSISRANASTRALQVPSCWHNKKSVSTVVKQPRRMWMIQIPVSFQSILSPLLNVWEKKHTDFSFKAKV